MSEHTFEGFVKFVNDVAKETPYKIICHRGWKYCAIGEYFGDTEPDPDLIFDGRPDIREAFASAGLGDYMETYEDAREVLEVYLRNGEVPAECYF